MKQSVEKEHLNRDEWKYVLVILAACLLPRLLMCLLAYPLRTRVDELATMGGAAYLAGLDWSGVMSEAPYYGTGYTGLFGFIFRLTDNPLVIYRFLISVGGILQALTGVLCYRMMSCFFQVRNKLVLIISSIMSSYMVVTRAVIVYNEHMLIFLMWIITYLLLYINYYEEKKKKRIATVILALIMAYSLTIHTRSIVFILILAVVALLAYLYKKIKIIDIPVFGAICLTGYILAQCYVKWIQKAVWQPAEGEVLVNTSVSVGGKLSNLASSDGWKAVFLTIAGQVNTISVITAGVAFLLLSVMVALLWKERGRKKQTEKDIILSLLVLIYCVGCIAITIVGQAITWLNGTKEVVKTGAECDLYAIKAFTYMRYFGPYCGPLVMMFGVLWEKRSGLLRKAILPTIIGLAVVQFAWIVGIVPYMANMSPGNQGSVEALICLIGADRQSVYDYNFFYKVAAVGILLTLVILLTIRYNKKELSLGIVSVILIYQYLYNAWVWDITGNQVRGYDMADASYELIQQLEEEMQLPNTIYVMPNNNDIYQYQFMLNRYTVCSGMPEQDETEENVILFSRNVIEEELEGYTLFQLEKKEHVYVKGEQLTHSIAGILAE